MGTDLYHSADDSVRLEAVVASLLVIALAFLVGIVLASLGRSTAASVGVTTDSAPILAYSLQTVLTFGGFLVVVAGYLSTADRPDLLRYRTPTLSDLAWIVGGFLALVAAATVVGEIITALGLESAQNQIIIVGREHPTLFLAMLPVTLLFVAPAEELVYRGIVQGQFRRAYGPLPAVVIASLLFGVSHSGALSGSGKLTYLAVATILALILGAVYERTENVLVPIGIHAAWNTTLYLGEWLRVVHGITVLS